MIGRAGSAIASLVMVVASVAVYDAPQAQGLAALPRPGLPGDVPLLHKAADSGVDIVRMPPRPPTPRSRSTVSRTCTVERAPTSLSSTASAA